MPERADEDGFCRLQHSLSLHYCIFANEGRSVNDAHMLVLAIGSLDQCPPMQHDDTASFSLLIVPTRCVTRQASVHARVNNVLRHI